MKWQATNVCFTNRFVPKPDSAKFGPSKLDSFCQLNVGTALQDPQHRQHGAHGAAQGRRRRRRAGTHANLRLLVLCCHPLLTHWLNSCWADWPAQAGSNRKAGRGKSVKLKLLLLYSIHATYRRIQMTEMQKSQSKTSLLGAITLIRFHELSTYRLTCYVIQVPSTKPAMVAMLADHMDMARPAHEDPGSAGSVAAAASVLSPPGRGHHVQVRLSLNRVNYIRNCRELQSFDSLL